MRMVESSNPALAAAVAALIRKLWPAYFLSAYPIAARTFLTAATNTGLYNGDPSVFTKNGPAAPPLLVMYATTAVTGQRGQSVWPA